MPQLSWRLFNGIPLAAVEDEEQEESLFNEISDVPLIVITQASVLQEDGNDTQKNSENHREKK